MADKRREVEIERMEDRIIYVDDEGVRHEYREETIRRLRLKVGKLQLVGDSDNTTMGTSMCCPP